ncbi:hypothetical protein D3C87_2053590 [compost metagenome]
MREENKLFRTMNMNAQLCFLQGWLQTDYNIFEVFSDKKGTFNLHALIDGNLLKTFH